MYYTETDYQNTYEEVLGVFSTYYNERNKPRVNNLYLACEAINNTVILPGEVFSYNETIGPTNQANGYKKAKIIVKGLERSGYGGGVCQVSSTLYNAAEIAGMEIIERHPHSKKVLYVGEGQDAATSYGTLDLKFKNIYNYPVKIASLISDGVITVLIEAL